MDQQMTVFGNSSGDCVRTSPPAPCEQTFSLLDKSHQNHSQGAIAEFW
jgi:hypothetical protein